MEIQNGLVFCNDHALGKEKEKEERRKRRRKLGCQMSLIRGGTLSQDSGTRLSIRGSG